MKEIYPIEEGEFSHLTCSEDRFELKVGQSSVVFGIDTATQVVDLLSAYIQDRQQRYAASQAQWLLWEGHIDLEKTEDLPTFLRKQAD